MAMAMAAMAIVLALTTRRKNRAGTKNQKNQDRNKTQKQGRSKNQKQNQGRSKNPRQQEGEKITMAMVSAPATRNRKKSGWY